MNLIIFVTEVTSTYGQTEATTDNTSELLVFICSARLLTCAEVCLSFQQWVDWVWIWIK